MIKNFISHNVRHKTLLSILALCLPAILLYSPFLWSPIFFDDKSYFNDLTMHDHYMGKVFSFDLRWLPYATIEWTRDLLGLNMIWYRVGNLSLHIATTITLFLFLRRLFNLVLPNYEQNKNTLSLHWLAFFGALIFSLHPISVYAVGYLIQRSTLMATLFALLTWRFFLEGLVKKNQLILFCSALTYLFSALSKEHSIMVPAVAVAILLLIKDCPSISDLVKKNTEDKEKNSSWIRLVWPTLALYGLIGVYVIIQIKSSHILGLAYEPRASEMISRLNGQLDPTLVYPLSILNQSTLFFKYLYLWLAPNPSNLSIDMYHAFPSQFISWPYTVGFVFFILYPIVALYLLLQKKINGLLGFALLCPWLLFATELASVRIQEAFVLYRSYLWMVGIFAALPFIFQKVNAKMTASILTIIVIFMLPMSYIKLTSFSQHVLLWDDAVQLAERNGIEYLGMERIYYNRGVGYSHLKAYDKAITDYTTAIRLGSKNSRQTSYSYNNRGYMYLESHQYQLALNDFQKSFEIEPENKWAKLGIIKTLEIIKNQ